jgi:hypothetical protein
MDVGCSEGGHCGVWRTELMTMMKIICLYRTMKMDKTTEENEVRG